LALLCNPEKYSNLMPNSNLYQLTWLTCLTNMITTGLIKHIVDVVGNMAKGTINVNHKAIVEVLMEVHFKVIARRNAIFVRNQIAGQLGILWTDERRHIINFARAHSILGIGRSLWPISKAS